MVKEPARCDSEYIYADHSGGEVQGLVFWTVVILVLVAIAWFTHPGDRPPTQYDITIVTRDAEFRHRSLTVPSASGGSVYVYDVSGDRFAYTDVMRVVGTRSNDE